LGGGRFLASKALHPETKSQGNSRSRNQDLLVAGNINQFSRLENSRSTAAKDRKFINIIVESA
jgi:hypothetical protein